MPRTPSSAEATAENAPSKIGASSSQNPRQMACRTCVIFSKSKPRAFSRSTTPEQKLETLLSIPCQIEVILSRNSSLFFHRSTNAAASTAIAATTAATTPTTPPRAVPSPPAPPAAPPIAVVRVPIPFARLAKPVIAFPVVDVTVPRITRTGPTAAARAAKFAMFFFVPSSREFSLATNSWIFDVISRIFGIRISPKEMASSCRADFRIVTCPFRLSLMTAAICSAVPLYSSTTSAPLFRASVIGITEPSVVFTNVSEQVEMALFSFWTSVSFAFTIARSPLMPRAPASIAASLACSAFSAPKVVTFSSSRAASNSS